MSLGFQPFVIGSGLSAWTLLKSTLTAQKTAFNSNYLTQSDTRYFREMFDDLNTPEDVVSDRRVLRVVLGAYGLSDDIENRHFIKTVMSEGISNPEALANRLSDQRYRTLARDFDFSKPEPAHKTIKDLADSTVQKYRAQTFEVEIGKSNPDMRLALGFSGALEEISQRSSSNNTAWFQVLATPPVRELMQTALGLPSEFSRLDIDDQHQRMIDKSKQVFGTDQVADFTEEGMVEQVTRRFLIMRQADTLKQTNSLQTALVLLSAIPRRE